MRCLCSTHYSYSVTRQNKLQPQRQKSDEEKQKQNHSYMFFVFILRFAHEVASVQVIFIIPNLVDRSQKLKQAVATKQISDLQRKWEIQPRIPQKLRLRFRFCFPLLFRFYFVRLLIFKIISCVRKSCRNRVYFD